ncbi:fatty-acid amide hydrolase 2-like isoform X2 [Cimex lectularius]|uniref:Amidase domain-containing protein n=1 Tax=Cimex lectularius TaxID=79782 RepID=A0A8I6S639_CIMLE|nr:fatty-acid amide hydrolase 2-like isoform X2 [Cimex lectularius]
MAEGPTTETKVMWEPKASVFKTVGVLMNNIIKYFLLALRMVTCVVFFYAPFRKKKLLPPIKSHLLKMSATQLVQKLKSKEVKSVEIVKAFINRIEDVNPIINSVVEDRFKEAIKEAEDVDAIIRDSKDLDRLFEEKPLFGVPLSVKETVAVKGMSNNSARSRVSSNIAEKDADVVHRLKNAGAIPLVVTNTPELCFYFETYNSRTGRTVNPYDTRRTPGGSSGGEAAIISSAGSVIGIGSDIAGSIRIPASFCGIFGHKPTPGYISNDGHIPTSDDPDWNKYFTLGPLTRYAEDLPLMMKIMTNRQRFEKLKFDEKVDLSKIKVYYMYGEGPKSLLQDAPIFSVKKAVKEAVDGLVKHLKCHSEKVQLECLRNSLLLSTLIMRMKGIENVQQRDENPDNWGIVDVVKVIFKKLTLQTSASISLVLWGPLKYFINRFPQPYREKAENKQRYCRQALQKLLGDDGVLIYPTFPWEAPFTDTMGYQVTNVSYCTLFTTTGLPVSQVPITLNNDGLPIGVQWLDRIKIDCA